jgi:hypothetical protein
MAMRRCKKKEKAKRGDKAEGCWRHESR